VTTTDEVSRERIGDLKIQVHRDGGKELTDHRRFTLAPTSKLTPATRRAPGSARRNLPFRKVLILALSGRRGFAGRPLCADFVEEVGGVPVRDGARSQAHVSSFVLRQALGRAAGSALPAF
jgi:hypothetical protein